MASAISSTRPTRPEGSRAAIAANASFFLSLVIPAIPSQICVSVQPGETAFVDVGFAQGLLCDDLSIIQAELDPGERCSFNRLRGDLQELWVFLPR